MSKQRITDEQVKDMLTYRADIVASTEHDALLDLRDARERIAELEAARDKLITTIEAVRLHWGFYRDFVKAKYPALEGERWVFTCPHHKAIDAMLAHAPRAAKE